ncbi:MAG: nucleotidyltransferase domain-containing protein [Candidatus Lambdaproteobacteria bacterium]|nr:nucleotidyltransferase domain-containing protein [Candidatus Lambdaproteobacteria bacterium]
MHSAIQDKLPELEALCRRYQVKRLELFGSAAGSRFDPVRSDIDFLVEYLPVPDKDPWNQFFGFKADLERLFDRKVDLVESRAIRNRYFREEVEETKVPVYAA